ncbi:hypothetical protein [Fictibacillus terranigra]|uniref:SR1 protein n=1 Tax=Fictibacillus terranigra TaxID=3058424 RepID=A0ABT8E9B2_9BACL|nr:hypothetical protein [Fictibacillus sp. CENA-BCM004]MDN4074506.1 hypothetical protein [Fictibacillus sp. CENA-BCM004]
MKKCEICGVEESQNNDQTDSSPKILHVCEDCQKERKLDHL